MAKVVPAENLPVEPPSFPLGQLKLQAKEEPIIASAPPLLGSNINNPKLHLVCGALDELTGRHSIPITKEEFIEDLEVGLRASAPRNLASKLTRLKDRILGSQPPEVVLEKLSPEELVHLANRAVLQAVRPEANIRPERRLARYSSSAESFREILTNMRDALMVLDDLISAFDLNDTRSFNPLHTQSSKAASTAYLKLAGTNSPIHDNGTPLHSDLLASSHYLVRGLGRIELDGSSSTKDDDTAKSEKRSDAILFFHQAISQIIPPLRTLAAPSILLLKDS